MSIVMSILSIIGIVLKWILLILLGILGFILFLVILVLSCSICYRISGVKDEEGIRAKARVTYLFSLLRVYVDFVDKKLTYKVKAAWFTVASSEKDPEKTEEEEEKLFSHGELEIETLNKVEKPAPEITKEAEAETEKTEPKKTETGKEETAETDPEKTLEEILPSAASEEDKQNRIEVFERKSMLQTGIDIIRMKPEEALKKWQSRKQEAKALKEKEKAEKEALRLKKQEERQAKQEEKEQRRAEKQAKKQQAENEKAAEGKPKRSLSDLIDLGIDKLFDLGEKLLDLIDTILDAPDKVEEILDEKVGPKWRQFEKYKRLYDKYPRKKETIMVFLHLIRNILRPLVPKRYEASVHYGTGDPATTAKILGAYYALAPQILPKQNRRQHLEVSCDMEEKVLLFDAETRGHFSINTVLIFPLLKAIFNRDTFRLVRFILKLRKQLKKQKEKEAAKNKTENKEEVVTENTTDRPKDNSTENTEVKGE